MTEKRGLAIKDSSDRTEIQGSEVESEARQQSKISKREKMMNKRKKA